MAHEPASSAPSRRPSDQPGLAPDQLAALLRINQALSGLRDREALFAAIAGAIEGLVPAERLVVRLPGSQGTPVGIWDVPAGTKVFEGEQIPEDRMQSAIVLPLLARGRCLGALGFLARTAGAWDLCPSRRAGTGLPVRRRVEPARPAGTDGPRPRPGRGAGIRQPRRRQ
jgi:hypothetical protein